MSECLQSGSEKPCGLPARSGTPSSYVFRRRNFRQKLFCKIQSSRNDQKICNSDWHYIKNRWDSPLRPSNDEEQWNVECEYKNNNCPEPDVFPQIPADFDGNRHHS